MDYPPDQSYFHSQGRAHAWSQCKGDCQCYADEGRSERDQRLKTDPSIESHAQCDLLTARNQEHDISKNEVSRLRKRKETKIRRKIDYTFGASAPLRRGICIFIDDRIDDVGR